MSKMVLVIFFARSGDSVTVLGLVGGVPGGITFVASVLQAASDFLGGLWRLTGVNESYSSVRGAAYTLSSIITLPS